MIRITIEINDDLTETEEEDLISELSITLAHADGIDVNTTSIDLLKL